MNLKKGMSKVMRVARKLRLEVFSIMRFTINKLRN